MSIDGVCSACAGQVQNAQSLAVLRQALDAQKAEGQAALQLLSGAAQVATGAPEPGKGSQVDVQA